MVISLICRVLVLATVGTAQTFDLDDLVKKTYASFDSNFPHHRWSEFTQQFEKNLAHYANSTASTA
jgi:hypothetical protein